MAIDLDTERVLSLSDATKALPSLGGKRLHPSTIWRWCKHGLGGVRLEYARLGKRIITTHEAIGRFAQALADANDKPRGPKLDDTPKPRTDKRRQRDIDTAENELAKAGI